MGFFSNIFGIDGLVHERAVEIASDLVDARLENFEARSTTFQPRHRTEAEIAAAIANGEPSSASPYVNWESTLKVSAAQACARLLAQGLAQPSCKLLRTDDAGARDEATDHKLFEILGFEPNPEQTAFEFREMLGLHMALTGNAFVRVIRSGNRIVSLWPLLPQDVTVRQNTDRTLAYDVKGEGVGLTSRDIWHIRGLSWNGYQGLEIIKLAANGLGLAMATEEYGSSLFRNGARPAGVMSIQAATPEQLDAAALKWNANYGGLKNANKTAFINAGSATYTPIASTANEAQWTEARRHQIEEICRAFGVRPSMVYTTGATSYASVEQEFLAHVKFTLAPWHTRFEQSAARSLLTPAERKAGLRIKLNTNALLRGSVAERMATYQNGLSMGWLTINEVRRDEDRPAFDFPEADLPKFAANIFGDVEQPQDEPAQEPAADEETQENEAPNNDPKDDEVTE